LIAETILEDILTGRNAIISLHSTYWILLNRIHARSAASQKGTTIVCFILMELKLCNTNLNANKRKLSAGRLYFDLRTKIILKRIFNVKKFRFMLKFAEFLKVVAKRQKIRMYNIYIFFIFLILVSYVTSSFSKIKKSNNPSVVLVSSDVRPLIT